MFIVYNLSPKIKFFIKYFFILILLIIYYRLNIINKK